MRDVPPEHVRHLTLDAVIPWLELGVRDDQLARARWLLERRPDLSQVPSVRRWMRRALRGREQQPSASAIQHMLAATWDAGPVDPRHVQVVPCSVSWSEMSSERSDDVRRCGTCQEVVTRVWGRQAAAPFVGKGCVWVMPTADDDLSGLYTTTRAMSGDEDAPDAPRSGSGSAERFFEELLKQKRPGRRPRLAGRVIRRPDADAPVEPPRPESPPTDQAEDPREA